MGFAAAPIAPTPNFGLSFSFRGDTSHPRQRDSFPCPPINRVFRFWLYVPLEFSVFFKVGVRFQKGNLGRLGFTAATPIKVTSNFGLLFSSRGDTYHPRQRKSFFCPPIFVERGVSGDTPLSNLAFVSKKATEASGASAPPKSALFSEIRRL